MDIIHRIKRKLEYFRDQRFRKTMSGKVAKSVESPRQGKTIYLFCAPVHPNLGDQAQTMCILRWFAKYYPDYEVIWIPMQLKKADTLANVKKRISPEDLVFIHSGYLTTELYGYLDFMAEIARTFTDNKITIFPQTINIKTEEAKKGIADAYNSHPRLTLMCRDEVSYQSGKDIFTCQLILYPDFVTSLIGKEEFGYRHKRDGVLMVTRNDKEKFFSDSQLEELKQKLESGGAKVDHIDTTIKISPFAWINRREKVIKKYLELFAKYKVVITDRYHDTIFSQIVGTPTIVIPSNDHKLKSGVKWFPEDFNDRLFYIESLEDICDKALELSKEDLPAISCDWFENNYWSKLKDRIDG